MIALLDINVLFALAWPNHVHHDVAHVWFHEHQSVGWATCPATQAGFVRISANRAANPQAKSVREAIALLQRIVALPGHRFLEDDIAIASSELIWHPALVGHRQVADAHLLAVARRHGAYVATLDRAMRNLVPEKQRGEALVIISSSP